MAEIVTGFDSRYWDGILTAENQKTFKFFMGKFSQGKCFTPKEGWNLLSNNWKRTRDVYKIPRGPYHYMLFSHPWYDPITYGKENAQNFWNTCQEHFEGDIGEIPPTIDVESHWAGMVGGEGRVATLRACLEETEKLFGRVPLIYTARWYWDRYIAPYTGDWQYWKEHELWEADPPPDTPIAGWGNSCAIRQVALGKAWAGFNTTIDVDEVEDTWLAQYWKPTPPSDCTEAVEKALEAQAIIYEAEIANLKAENEALKTSEYNQALNDVIGFSESAKR